MIKQSLPDDVSDCHTRIQRSVPDPEIHASADVLRISFLEHFARSSPLKNDYFRLWYHAVLRSFFQLLIFHIRTLNSGDLYPRLSLKEIHLQLVLCPTVLVIRPPRIRAHFQILDIQNDFISLFICFLLFRCVDQHTQHNDRFQRVPVWFFFFTAFLTDLHLIEMAGSPAY